MHKIATHGHGDIHPRNVMPLGNKFTYIEVSPEDNNRPAAYDFGTLLYYLPYIYSNINGNVCTYMYTYDKIINHVKLGH